MLRKLPQYLTTKSTKYYEMCLNPPYFNDNNIIGY